jgi:hypothetical protein
MIIATRTRFTTRQTLVTVAAGFVILAGVQTPAAAYCDGGYGASPGSCSSNGGIWRGSYDPNPTYKSPSYAPPPYVPPPPPHRPNTTWNNGPLNCAGQSGPALNRCAQTNARQARSQRYRVAPGKVGFGQLPQQPQRRWTGTSRWFRH